MPELPEVETMRRGILGIVGTRILKIRKPRCRYRPITISPNIPTIHRRLAEQTITDVTRLGKRVLIHADRWVLILQPKMTGLVCLEAPPDADHVRLEVLLDNPALPLLRFWDRRGLGTVELLEQSQIHDRIILGKLGPDALTIDRDDFYQRFNKTNRPIKVALLDQKLVAGVGNLYASEMLHVARIHPATPSSKVSRRRVSRLFDAMRSILLEAIAHEGSTLSDGTYRNALNDPGSYQSQHLVYDRADHPCPTCNKSPIQRIVQAQRSTFFCPRCQKS